MSPIKATVSPAIRPRCSRIVRMSSSPCVGCSCGPSPALTTAQPTFCDSRCGVPGVEWRMTITSTFMASMFLAVSMNVSPLDTTAARGRELDGVGPQPSGRQGKTVAGARGILEKQVGQRLALQCGEFSLAAARRRLERRGGIQNRHASPRPTGSPDPTDAGASQFAGNVGTGDTVGSQRVADTVVPPWAARLVAGFSNGKLPGSIAGPSCAASSGDTGG